MHSQINGSLARAAIVDLASQGVIRVVSRSGAVCTVTNLVTERTLTHLKTLSTAP